MAFDLQLCEAAYNELGRNEKLRRAYRAYLQQHTRQFVKHALNNDETGLAWLLAQARTAPPRQKSGGGRS